MLYNQRTHVLIESTVTEIPQRLKEVNPYYYVLLNKKTQKFEIHRSDHNYTYCLTIPHPELDARAIDMVRMQNWQDQQNLIKEIEEHNAKIDRANQISCRDTLDEMTKDLYRYGKSTEREVTEVKKGVMY